MSIQISDMLDKYPNGFNYKSTAEKTIVDLFQLIRNAIDSDRFHNQFTKQVPVNLEPSSNCIGDPEILRQAIYSAFNWMVRKTDQPLCLLSFEDVVIKNVRHVNVRLTVTREGT